MDKRLLKRHKREVSRARVRTEVSEPDVRTPEQIKAAREASRPTGAQRAGPSAMYSTPSLRNRAGASVHSAAKADA